jgi:hypothetical protein
VAGNVEHAQFDLRAGADDLVAFANRMVDAGDGLVRRAIDRHRRLGQQFGHAADVVRVVMGDQDGGRVRPSSAR